MGYDIVSLLPGFCAAFLGLSGFEEGEVVQQARLNIAALDYSVRSLHAVDDYLDVIRPMRETIADQDFTNTVLASGCYVGEVLRRNGREKWRWVNYDEYIQLHPQMQSLVPEGIGSAAVLMTEDNRKVLLPINKVVRNLLEGPENEIHYFVSGYAADP